ncbi:hypothetical protein GDO86_004072 [Hymenochirus boettgeri]|uniref:Sodium/potassium-transporting ATPase subunit beta n=1 Tax=Hymenochirus boettgeri TaxID=247094 RepID=A0A8T2K4C5_9PIPI|nr:hypothetical protein GDO86_004072 [Hymenochirus boettgeri]
MATFNEKKTCSQRMENFGRFVWNPDTGEVLGRTFVKWVYISLYYAAFYVIMIGIFALSIYSLMKTLSPYEPDYQDQIQSPGVTMRPNPYVDESIQLFYNMFDNTTYSPIVNSLCDFLSVYDAANQTKMMNKDCTNQTNIASILYSSANLKHACQFTREMLGNCSGEHDPTYGYKYGKPCLFIKMNRKIKFTPGNNTTPLVQCTSKSQNLGKVEYYPGNDTYGTIGIQYFPYHGKKMQPNYTNPIVAVKLLNPKLDVEIEVVCKVLGPGIVTDNPHDPYEGKVTFKLKIENKNPLSIKN